MKLYPSSFVRKLSAILIIGLLTGCAAKETHRTLEPVTIKNTYKSNLPPTTVSIGKFVNRSTYMNGLFADSTDKLGSQAEQILVTHISSSPAFILADRRNLEALEQEAKFSKSSSNIIGAQVVFTGAVTEFGRKETGTRSLGGLIHKTKTQTLYAKVSLSAVDVRTSQVIGTYQGAGEYNLTNKEVLGIGGYAGYDSTLADKVLNLAIMEAVEQLVERRQVGQW